MPFLHELDCRVALLLAVTVQGCHYEASIGRGNPEVSV
jgi:hypothetical protein